MSTDSEPEHPLFDQIIHLDQSLFYFINSGDKSPGLDSVFLWLRNPSSWIFLYVSIAIFVIWNMRWMSIKWMVGLLILFALCDGISSHFIKDWVGRLRPCNDPDLPFSYRLLLNYHPSGLSFTSSHASNHFGLALFFSYTFRHLLKKSKRLSLYIKHIYCIFFLWAFSVGYAQIYIGIHYPLDILGGAILGLIIAYGLQRLLGKWIFLLPYFFKKKSI